MGVFDLKRLLGASLALAILASGCTKVSQTGEAGGRVNSFTQPHVLRIGAIGDVNTLNPHLGQFSTIGWVSSMTMAYLIKWDAHNTAYPELATEVPTQQNGGVSKDGLTITYHLRKGVKWSDGASFDADDVVFSTKAVLNPANNEVGRLGWDQITKIDEPDKYTVIYHLKKPYSPFIETFFSTAGANPCVIPKHILGSLPNINNAPYNAKPIGIGPFKYERWDRNAQIVLLPNPLYFRGAPKIQRIVLKLIPDRNTLLSQLEAKEVDMWPIASGNYYDRLKQVDGYSVIRRPSYFFDHLDMNTTHSGLNDPVVRQALRLAWDRNERLQKIAHGIGTLSDSVTPIGAPYEVKVAQIPYDPAQANKLLDQAGWVRGADGIRAKNGVKLSFSYAAIAGLPDVDNGLELLRANWKQIGVDITIQHYATALFFAPLQSGGIVYGNKWDMTGFSWQNEAIGDYSPIYGCHSFPPNGQNVPRWCNEQAQAAMDALFAHYEQALRNKDVQTVAKAIYDDVPIIVQDQREDLFAVNKDLKNFVPNSVAPFDNMMNVDI